MCNFGGSPSIPAPQMATERAAAKLPDAQAAAVDGGGKQKNQLRAAASTVLTSGSGVTQNAATAKKTLLGA